MEEYAFNVALFHIQEKSSSAYASHPSDMSDKRKTAEIVARDLESHQSIRIAIFVKVKEN